jgi:M6 family metalloprotease-like protein
VPPTVPRLTRESGLTPSLSGTLHLVWGDPHDRHASGHLSTYLVDRSGRATQVVLPAALQNDFATLRSYDGHRVVLNGSLTPAADASLNPVFRATSVAPAEFISTMQGTVQTGNKKYLTILCKFPDYVAATDTAFGKHAYQKWIGEGDVSRTYPSLNHYWYEQSYGKVNFDNSVVKGWYTLPHNRLHYLQPDTTTDQIFARLDSLLIDCTAQADPDVNFPDYLGIVVQFNHVLDCCSWGGTGWTLNYDGQSKVYGVAWMADWADQAVYAHESGHSLSLPHSSGNYGNTYDSDWDVMSNSYIYWDAGLTTATYVSQGVISYDKDFLGWIDASRKVSVLANHRQTVFVDRLDQPSTPMTRLMVTAPYGASGHYYTVESRRFAGYDSHLDGEGVILHDVDPSGHGVGRPAFVVDRNGDANTTPDASALFGVGESFDDATNHVHVSVNAQAGTGYGVTVSSGTFANTWNPEAQSPLAREKAAAVAVGTDLFVLGGVNGSGVQGRADVYDTRTDLWRKARPMPAVRAGLSAVNYNGNIYVFGGKDDLGNLQATVWKYNPGLNSWTLRASMPAAGGCGGAAAIGTKIYVFVGCTTGSDYTNVLYRYDPVANSWSTLATSPRVHAAPVVAAVSGKLYVVGGLGNDGNPVAAMDVYDPAGSWAQGLAMPITSAGATGGAYNGQLYVVGGLRTLSTLVAASYMYDPGGNSWTAKASISTKRARLAGAFVGDALQTVGGSNLVPKVLQAHEVYNP